MKIMPTYINQQAGLTQNKFNYIHNANSTLSFQANLDEVAPKTVIQHIREHLWDNLVPYLKYHEESRKNEYELSKMILRFARKANVDDKRLKGLAIDNFRKIYGNAYRGEALCDWKTKYLKNFKEAGIEQILDLYGRDEDYKVACIENGLRYSRYLGQRDVLGPEYCENAFLNKEKEWTRYQHDVGIEDWSPEMKEGDKQMFMTNYNREVKEFIKEFIKFIKLINKDNYYIGCRWGTERTDTALLLSWYFNPKDKQLRLVEPHFWKPKYLDNLRNFYNNLTTEDKKQLGWTEGFEKQLRLKLGIS